MAGRRVAGPGGGASARRPRTSLPTPGRDRSQRGEHDPLGPTRTADPAPDAPEDQHPRGPYRVRGPDALSRRAQLAVAVLLPVGAFAALTTFAVFQRNGLVVGEPWVLAGLFTGAVVVAADVGRRPVTPATRSRHSTDGPPTLRLRLLLALVLCTALAWVGGWSLFLPAMAGLLAVVHVETAGHQVWRATVAATAGVTLLGQVLVAVGVVPSVLPPTGSHLAAAWLLLMSGTTVAYVGHSVARRQALRQGRRRAEARLAALMTSASDVVLVADGDLTVTYASPATTSVGRRPEDVVGSSVLDLVDRDHQGSVRTALEALVAAGDRARDSIDVLAVLPGQERRWFQWTAQNLLADPLVEGIVVNQRDISDRLLQQAALQHAATHDPLTGLANRSELLRLLRSALAEAGPSAGVGLLFLDLDGFKAVNDEHGHVAGDELLVAVARRLAGAVRPHDHVARMGGDEFCVLVTEVSTPEDLPMVTERLEQAVSEPVAVGGHLVRVGVSIGCAIATDPAADPAELLAEADGGMYAVKRTRTRTLPLTRRVPGPEVPPP